MNLCNVEVSCVRPSPRLEKQLEIKQFFDDNDVKYESYDKVIDRNCGLERPDFVIDAITHKLVVEVDENQHRNYNCEKARMFNIAQALGMPTIFIRYNPDKFKGDYGISKILKQRNLLAVIKWLIEEEPADESEFLRVIYLFYDGYRTDTIPDLITIKPKISSRLEL